MIRSNTCPHCDGPYTLARPCTCRGMLAQHRAIDVAIDGDPGEENEPIVRTTERITATSSKSQYVSDVRRAQCPLCDCGSDDATWHGDTLRVFCCDHCWRAGGQS